MKLINKKDTLIYLTFPLLFIACTHTYKEYDKESFPTYTWESDQKIIFNPTIKDISKPYKLTLGIRHLYGFQLKSIRVNVKSVSPSGKETMKAYEFHIKNAAGEYLRSCDGDLCDLETVVEENIKFEEPGQYTYSIMHNAKEYSIPGVMEFGLILDEVD